MRVATKHRAGRTERLTHATAGTLGVPVFHGIRCDRCYAGLHDSKGNPRWEIVGKLSFVCLGGCGATS